MRSEDNSFTPEEKHLASENLPAQQVPLEAPKSGEGFDVGAEENEEETIYDFLLMKRVIADYGEKIVVVVTNSEFLFELCELYSRIRKFTSGSADWLKAWFAKAAAFINKSEKLPETFLGIFDSGEKQEFKLSLGVLEGESVEFEDGDLPGEHMIMQPYSTGFSYPILSMYTIVSQCSELGELAQAFERFGQDKVARRLSEWFFKKLINDLAEYFLQALMNATARNCSPDNADAWYANKALRSTLEYLSGKLPESRMSILKDAKLYFVRKWAREKYDSFENKIKRSEKKKKRRIRHYTNKIKEFDQKDKEDLPQAS